MIHDCLRALRADGASRLGWIALLALPVGMMRAAVGPLEVSAGGPFADAASLRLQAMTGALVLWTALLAHGLLTARILARLARRRIARRELLAIMLPASGLACCHAAWQALALGAAAILGFVNRLYGPHLLALFLVVGLAAILQYGAARLTAMAGAFVAQLPTAGVPATHDLAATAPGWLQASVPMFLAVAYVLARAPVQAIAGLDLATGAMPAVAVGVLEALVLLIWLTANALAWHRDHGDLAGDEDLTRIFS